MADYTKKHFGRSLNDIAVARATEAIKNAGYALPCSVVKVVSSGIVTIKFEVNSGQTPLPQVTVPIGYPEYIRYPIQVGDKGVVFPADAKLGGLTGLGSGLPTLGAPPGNLSALTFFWLGSNKWSATDDPNALVMYGPNGVVVRDAGENCVLTINGTGATLTGPAASLSVEGNLSAGNGISCSFTTPTGQTVTVVDGIVTNLY